MGRHLSQGETMSIRLLSFALTVFLSCLSSCAVVILGTTEGDQTKVMPAYWPPATTADIARLTKINSSVKAPTVWVRDETCTNNRWNSCLQSTFPYDYTGSSELGCPPGFYTNNKATQPSNKCIRRDIVNPYSESNPGGYTKERSQREFCDSSTYMPPPTAVAWCGVLLNKP
jgi:hypothetical protein